MSYNHLQTYHIRSPPTEWLLSPMVLLTIRRLTFARDSRAHVEDVFKKVSAAERFQEVLTETAKLLPPFFGTLRNQQAKLFGIDAAKIEASGPSNPYSSNNYINCEIFIAQNYFLVLTLEGDDKRTIFFSSEILEPEESSPQSQPGRPPAHLSIYAIGTSMEYETVLDQVSDIVGAKFEMPVKAYHYKNSRLKELRSEITSESIKIDDGQLIAVSALSGRSNRTLAMAIKSSGGLLKTDAVKPLPQADAINIQTIKDALIDAELISSEFVVICSSSNSQVIRVARVEDLPEFASKGLKCACGKPISEEAPQELLTITDRGRFLLDKSRWMSIMLKQSLIELGILPSDILLECQMGGDEIDCIANISGELVMFELKDKEFNLGNAYSFGAKTSLINPRYAVVITTAYVGNDVKDHFRRARSSGRRRAFELGSDNAVKISYIEGVENFHQGIGELVSKIYQRDAETILGNALPFATPSSKTLLDFIGDENR